MRTESGRAPRRAPGRKRSRMKSEESQTYDDIADELSDPHITLADLDPAAVAKAKAYAKKQHKKWPPRPATSPYDITITTWST